MPNRKKIKICTFVAQALKFSLVFRHTGLPGNAEFNSGTENTCARDMKGLVLFRVMTRRDPKKTEAGH